MDPSTHPAARPNPGRTLYWTLLLTAMLAVGATAGLVQIQRARTLDLMGDESGWIAASGYYTDLVLAGDFTHESWEGKALESWGSLNPQLGKLLLGFGLRLHPHYARRDSEFRGTYSFSSSFEENAAKGNVPFEATVIRAREVNAAFYGAALALLFLAVALHTNALAGLVTALLTLTNDWIVAETTLALTDAYYYCFVFGLFCLAGAILRTEAFHRQLLVYGLAGVIAGAACSVKVNGLPFAAAFVASVMVYGASARGQLQARQHAACFALFLACALAVVYALNPYFWPTDHWRNVLEFPQLYRRWPELFAVQRSLTPWPASGRVPEISRVLLILFTPFMLERVLLVVGAGALLVWLGKSLKSRQQDMRVVPLLFFLTNVLFLFALMPVNYRRYYLPAVISMKAVTAIGFSAVALACIRWVARGGSAAGPPPDRGA